MNGFRNLGNTCFMNSGLQMLINNDDLNRLILNTESDDTFLKLYKKFITTYKNNNNRVINPQFVKDMVSSVYDMFSGYEQHDSDEFVSFFLNILNEKVGDDKIDELFQIKIKNTVKCKVVKCLNKSFNTEKCVKLELNITNDTLTLDDCYREFKVSVRLEGDEMVHCEKCNKKRIVSKKSEIESWPDNLIIHLKRFTSNGRKLSKNNKDIDVPFEWRKGFQLKGGVLHSGRLSGGHYVYFGEHQGKWYLYNDSNVSELSENDLHKIKNKAYIYYFKK